MRTFLTLAELIRPFLDMFSISSTLVKPLHLQAIIRGGGRWWWPLDKLTEFLVSVGPLAIRLHLPDLRLHSEWEPVIHSLGKVTCCASSPLYHTCCFPCFLFTWTSDDLPVGPPVIMAVGQPTRPRYQRLARLHQTPAGEAYVTNPPDSIPTGNVPIFVASLVLARAGIFTRTWLCSPGRFQTSLPC